MRHFCAESVVLFLVVVVIQTSRKIEAPSKDKKFVLNPNYSLITAPIV